MFDAQVVQTNRNSPRGQLLDQYVTARITQMDGIDIGLFDYDRHNAVYYFVVNSDEQIYLRYGGRDEDSPESYLGLESIELAMKLGLEQHELYKAGKLEKVARPEKKFPKDIRALYEEVTTRRRCVECHLIGDYEAISKEEEGTLDKLQDMFRSPDIRNIGILLDKPKGLVVKNVAGAVKDSGMESGDLITSLNDKSVLTFGDFLYAYDKLPRDTKTIQIGVLRNETEGTMDVILPKEWWWTDLYFRYWTIEPVLYFFSETLSVTEKKELDLPMDGFAIRVTEVDPAAQVYDLHELKQDDIIYEVDGKQSDPITNYADRHIQLTKTAGESMDIKLFRDGEPMEMTIWTHRQSFRKQPR
jgi:hypothetical protein